MEGGRVHYEFQEITHHWLSITLMLGKTLFAQKCFYKFGRVTHFSAQVLILNYRQSWWTEGHHTLVPLLQKNKNRIREWGSLFPCFPCNFSVSGYAIHWCTFQTSCLVTQACTHIKNLGQLWLHTIKHKFTRTAVSMSSSTCYKHAQITEPAPMLKFHSNSLCTKVFYASKLYLLRT